MALACPKCGSENVQKISLVRSAGITHVTTKHQSAVTGAGVGLGGIGVGVGASQGVSQGVQQSEISRQLNEEFATPPKPMLTKGSPFIRWGFRGYGNELSMLVVGLISIGLYNLVGELTSGQTHYPWLVNLVIFVCLVVFGLFGIYAIAIAILSAFVGGGGYIFPDGFLPLMSALHNLFGGKGDTPEIRQEKSEIEKRNKDEVMQYGKLLSKHYELRDKGFYCHACGNKFIMN